MRPTSIPLSLTLSLLVSAPAWCSDPEADAPAPVPDRPAAEAPAPAAAAPPGPEEDAPPAATEPSEPAEPDPAPWDEEKPAAKAAAHDERRDTEPTSVGETIVVTGDRRETTVARSVSAVDVVDAQDLRMKGRPTSPWQWLQGLPGVHATPGTGGIDGGVPRIRLRGANSYDTQVQVDGIPLEDPTATQGQPNLAALYPAGLERVEVIRGNQSGLYGSRAIGGVVDFQTVRPTSQPHAAVRGELGAYRTISAGAEATGPLSATTGFALSTAFLGSRGFSATTDADADGDARNHESDTIIRGGIQGRFEWRPRAGTTLYLGANTMAFNQEFDDGFSSGPDDNESKNVVKMLRVSAGGESRLSEKTRIGFDAAFDDSVRQLSSPSFSSTYYGKQEYAAVHLHQRVAELLEISGGVDGRRQDLDIKTAGYTHAHDWLGGGWLQALSSGESHEVALSAREDLHSNAGDAFTWRAAAAGFFHEEMVKPHASVGTGFRAPSLYEQSDPFAGNPDLEAQRSISYDGGLTLLPIEEALLDVTYFRTDYRTLIDYVDPDGFLGPIPGRYANIDAYSVHGVESSARLAAPESPYYVRAAYTWQVARELPGQAADIYGVYLPRHKIDATVGLNEQLLGYGAITASYVNGVRAGFGGTTDLPGYTLVGATVGMPFRKVWELYVRVENLLDQHYEVTPGFSTSGQAWYGGVSGRF
ncbi:MAG: TonB-dependent receptor [Planctomycetes bacterium]|nr:TonB-dependent receptor [Planctomycetota bacterium]